MKDFNIDLHLCGKNTKTLISFFGEFGYIEKITLGKTYPAQIITLSYTDQYENPEFIQDPNNYTRNGRLTISIDDLYDICEIGQ